MEKIMQAERPHLKVTYNGTNITHDISGSLLAFTYTDHMDEADTIDIQLEDTALKWQNEWYPEKGAKVEAEIGIDGGQVVNCGKFEIDEIELSGPPDSVNIRCIAVGFTNGKVRTHKSHVHEDKTLAEIVRTVANACGLTVQGTVSDVRVNRVVQRREYHIRFLRRLATEYGYTFNVRGTKAIFIPQKELEAQSPVCTFDKTELLNFSIRDKSSKTYAQAHIKFHNPETGDTVIHQESEGGVNDTDDVLELNYTAETKAQAIMMTQAALNAANKLQQSGNISLPGSPLLFAGNIITLTGIGLLSGKYIIKSAAHTVGISQGWLTDCEVYKVGFVDETKKKPKKKENT